MQQRRAQQPGHQRGVLHRVPEPPAAPAQLVVGPEAAERDAAGQRNPRRQHPGSHPARPGRVHPALQQRRHREGEGHREADVAQVEQRRVRHEPRVLQQRIELGPLERRRAQPQEGIGGEDQEPQERHPDQALDPQHPGLQRLAQPPAEQGHRRAIDAQDQHPQQHRPLVAAPGRGEAIGQRLLAVGMLGHQGDGKIAGDIARRQARNRRDHEAALQHGGRAAERHQHRIAPLRAPQGGARLDRRQEQCQNQGELPDFRSHGLLCSPSGLWRFRAHCHGAGNATVPKLRGGVKP